MTGVYAGTNRPILLRQKRRLADDLSSSYDSVSANDHY